jgi:hypothetical protein
MNYLINWRNIVKLSKIKVLIYALLIIVCYSSIAWAKATTTELNNIGQLAVTSIDNGGKLLFSDSPELVDKDGIMYADTIQGIARLYCYHVNNTNSPKRIFILLENNSAEGVSVEVGKYGLAQPSADYLAVGKQVQVDYFKSRNSYIVYVPPKSVRVLSKDMAKMIATKDMLVHGMFDINAEKPITVKFVMMAANGEIENLAKNLKILPADQWRLRGTFEHMNRLIIGKGKYDNNNKPVLINLADNNFDKYIEGIDATDGSKTQNYGNYGLLYRVYIPTNGQGSINYYLQPRGGVYAGALKIEQNYSKNILKLTPSKQTCFGDKDMLDMEWLGEYVVGEPLSFYFMPPGASNLPVALALVPKKS